MMNTPLYSVGTWDSGALIVFQVTVGSEGVNIVGQYDGKKWPPSCPACWLIGVMPMDEDTPIPDWPMRFKMAGNGYSPQLIIDAPEGVQVLCLNRKG